VYPEENLWVRFSPPIGSPLFLTDFVWLSYFYEPLFVSPLVIHNPPPPKRFLLPLRFPMRRCAVSPLMRFHKPMLCRPFLSHSVPAPRSVNLTAIMCSAFFPTPTPLLIFPFLRSTSFAHSSGKTLPRVRVSVFVSLRLPRHNFDDALSFSTNSSLKSVKFWSLGWCLGSPFCGRFPLGPFLTDHSRSW